MKINKNPNNKMQIKRCDIYIYIYSSREKKKGCIDIPAGNAAASAEERAIYYYIQKETKPRKIVVLFAVEDEGGGRGVIEGRGEEEWGRERKKKVNI